MIAILSSACILMANLGAIIDAILHPEIEYFDSEHIIVGISTAIVLGVMLTILFIYIERIQKGYIEIKRAEDALRENEERYRLLTNNVPDIIYSIDGEGNVVTVNNLALVHYGYSEQDLKGKPFLNFLHPEDQEIVMKSLINAVAEQREFTHKLQFRILTKKKDSYWFELNSRIRFDSQKRYAGEDGVLRDITDRKNAVAQLENEHLRLQGIIEGTNVGTWEWNIQTGETIYNDRWGEIIGYRLEELSPSSITTWQNLIHPDDLKRSAELLGRHLAGELPYYICECRIKHKHGHWVWVLDRGSIITRSAEGVPLKMFGTHTDISDRKKIETERESMINELQSALAEVRTLKGIVPICAGCKKIRDDKGFWEQVETNVQKHTEAKFSHGFCPECVEKYYPGQAERIRDRKKE